MLPVMDQFWTVPVLVHTESVVVGQLEYSWTSGILTDGQKYKFYAKAGIGGVLSAVGDAI